MGVDMTGTLQPLCWEIQQVDLFPFAGRLPLMVHFDGRHKAAKKELKANLVASSSESAPSNDSSTVSYVSCTQKMCSVSSYHRA
jgi:hypothetical protein